MEIKEPKQGRELKETPRIVITAKQIHLYAGEGGDLALTEEEFKCALCLSRVLARSRHGNSTGRDDECARAVPVPEESRDEAAEGQ